MGMLLIMTYRGQGHPSRPDHSLGHVTHVSVVISLEHSGQGWGNIMGQDVCVSMYWDGVDDGWESFKVMEMSNPVEIVTN